MTNSQITKRFVAIQTNWMHIEYVRLTHKGVRKAKQFKKDGVKNFLTAILDNDNGYIVSHNERLLQEGDGTFVHANEAIRKRDNVPNSMSRLEEFNNLS